MTFQEFQHEMIPIVQRWRQGFPMPVQERIFSFVRELGSLSFQRIVRSMLDTQRVAPLPKDFLEAAINERKRIFDRNTYKAPAAEYLCAFCGDLGVVVSQDSLMLCDCNDKEDYRAAKNKWKLPKWNPKYKREKCPRDWFNPGEGEVTLGRIQDIAKGWKCRIEIAEKYWQHKGVTDEHGEGMAERDNGGGL